MAHVTLDNYTKALSISKCGQSVILKRQPCEQNCYSPAILKAWQANMDIQYMINAYACVMYIASYVLKAEKGMGELLKQAAKELQQGNVIVDILSFNQSQYCFMAFLSLFFFHTAT